MMTSEMKAVWIVQLNIASHVLHSALSLADSSVPTEAREKLYEALGALHHADRLVRVIEVSK